jgi:hypothetical protein
MVLATSPLPSSGTRDECRRAEWYPIVAGVSLKASALGHDTVGESFEPNINTAQKAGTLTGSAKRMNLAQRSLPR